MSSYTCYCLILLFLFLYWLKKDIFHPAIIVTGLWLVLICLYTYTDHPLYPLSNKFYVAILNWIFPFVLTSIIVESIGGKYIRKTHRGCSPKIRLFNKLYPYMVYYAFAYIALLYLFSGYSFAGIRIFLVTGQFPPLLKMLMYLNSFMMAYVAYGILNYSFINKRRLVFLSILLLIVTLFNSNKSAFLSIFITFSFLLKHTGILNIKQLLFLLSVLFIFLIAVTFLRGDMNYYTASESPLLDYLYIYLLSPLTAFDFLLHSNAVLNVGSSGSGTFAFFYKFFNALGANYKITELGDWVQVPLPTNVFTILRGYYLDWGMIGISFMSIMMGGIWGFLYLMQKSNKKHYKLFYALIVPFLFFQSFGDYFWISFSVVIQYYFFSYILTNRFKVVEKNVSNA